MIYVVSGFFRSGTSRMMQCLEAGGIPLYYSKRRDALNEANTDSIRRPNPISLYEPDMDDLRMPGFPRQHDGHAIKMMVPWLNSLAVHDYRVVMLRRNPEAIMRDYEMTFHDYWDKRTRDQWIAEYRIRFNEAFNWFVNRRDVRSVAAIDLEKLIVDVGGMLESLEWPIDVQKAASVWQAA